MSKEETIKRQEEDDSVIENVKGLGRGLGRGIEWVGKGVEGVGKTVGRGFRFSNHVQ